MKLRIVPSLNPPSSLRFLLQVYILHYLRILLQNLLVIPLISRSVQLTHLLIPRRNSPLRARAFKSITACWLHFRLSADRGESSLCQFRVDLWSARQIPQPRLNYLLSRNHIWSQLNNNYENGKQL